MWLFHTVINIHTRPRDLHLTDPTSVKTLETACLYLCAKTGNRCLGTESGEADSSRLFSRSLSAKEPLRVGLVCRRQGQRGSLLLCMPKQWASHLQSIRVLCCCVLQVCCRCVAGVLHCMMCCSGHHICSQCMCQTVCYLCFISSRVYPGETHCVLAPIMALDAIHLCTEF